MNLFPVFVTDARGNTILDSSQTNELHARERAEKVLRQDPRVTVYIAKVILRASIDIEYQTPPEER